MLKRLEIVGFKSFAKKTILDFGSVTTAIVGPNGSGKSNVAEAFRFALGEQSVKSMRGKRVEDLIWGGSQVIPRASRASVAVIFDNTHRQFKIDFDEVRIERAVFRDGTSEYSINDSRVRLRDIDELLASANIGKAGNHTISQGEADRILRASPSERRGILEDALGLKMYEFKKNEALRKLCKTDENIKQVNMLRREIAPQLRFLEGQVAKLERADGLRAELVKLAQTYFAIEDAYLEQEKISITQTKRDASERLANVTAELARIEKHTASDPERVNLSDAMRENERKIEKITNARALLARATGRIEGALASAKERSEKVAHAPYAKIPYEILTTLTSEIDKQVKEATTSEAIRVALVDVGKLVKIFVGRFVTTSDDILVDEEDTAYVLGNEYTELVVKAEKLDKEYEEAKLSLERARESLTAHSEEGNEMRRRILDIAQLKAREENELENSKSREKELVFLSEALERAKVDATTLAGIVVVSYEMITQPPEKSRSEQEERKHSLERIQIRLEEAGGTGEDIRQEYKEEQKREAFLTTELDDLTKSAKSLNALINDLDTELAKYFSEGLDSVNAFFGKYFSLMFGGGGAHLALEESPTQDEEKAEEEPTKEGSSGIEIVVSLPKKKVHSLMQLSGGERALTSIALIFAMSQVNPPPFLILDETDAALDEANSRRYGDMIENLAKKSQLIVITHNRETMSRASILYGVTMGSDGVSKLLSVKLDEAVTVAK